MKDATTDDVRKEIVAEMGEEINSFLEFVESLKGDAGEKGGLERIEEKAGEVARRIGRTLVEGGARLQGRGRGCAARCACGGAARDEGDRDRVILTLLGEIRIRRAYYRCERCGRGVFPLDAQMGVGGGCLSAVAERAVALLGAQMPFGAAAKALKELTGAVVSRRSTARRCVQAGTKAARSSPVRQAAKEGMKQAVISADSCCINTLEGWKEVKCGTISAPGEGTRYVAAMASARPAASPASAPPTLVLS
jgi:hypothetical protein